MTYVGYDIVEELETVFLLTSDYSSRASVERNIPRCVDSAATVSGLNHEYHVFTVGSHDGERYEELAETAARDHSNADGEQRGYRLEPIPVDVSPDIDPVDQTVNDLHKAYGKPAGMIRKLLGAWMEASGDYEPSHFVGIYDRMASIY